MKIALISVHYPPEKTSCAIQMRDLAKELLKNGHDPIVIVPTEKTDKLNYVEPNSDIKIFRIPTFKINNIGNIRRAFNEILLPFCMISGIKKKKIPIKSKDLIVLHI